MDKKAGDGLELRTVRIGATGESRTGSGNTSEEQRGTELRFYFPSISPCYILVTLSRLTTPSLSFVSDLVFVCESKDDNSCGSGEAEGRLQLGSHRRVAVRTS